MEGYNNTPLATFLVNFFTIVKYIIVLSNYIFLNFSIILNIMLAFSMALRMQILCLSSIVVCVIDSHSYD